ncbi:MAG TPA: glutaredoxin family protein [Steroidobacteraceae bacterium]|nr:glutaredoxin family protein [Steroidobacteraceae bacterium]
MSANAGPRWTLVSRIDCHLCELMQEELITYLGERAADVAVLDVDADATLLRRFGNKVPVLLIDGEVACCGRFDRAEVERLARHRP